MIQIPAESTIFGPGTVPDKQLLLLSGTVRVQQSSTKGREIVLYRIEAGESCILTTACLLAQEEYLAQGVAETDIVAVGVSRGAFDQLIASSSVFRQFVFTSYSARNPDVASETCLACYGNLVCADNNIWLCDWVVSDTVPFSLIGVGAFCEVLIYIKMPLRSFCIMDTFTGDYNGERISHRSPQDSVSGYLVPELSAIASGN